MKLLLFTIIWFAYTGQLFAQNLYEVTAEKPRLEFSLKMDICKKRGDKYFDNDTTLYPQSEIDEYSGYKQANNFIAINFNWKRYYPKNYILNYEIRYKLWGFKEDFWIPNIYGPGKNEHIGFSSYVVNLDAGVSLMKRYLLREGKYEVRPKIGLSFFVPFSQSFYDSVYHEPFGNTEFNLYYRAPFIRLGGNLGLQFCYHLSRNYSISLSTEYWTPFNNQFSWTVSQRVKGTHYPWRKWAKKDNALYFGIGFDVRLRRRYDHKIQLPR